ncbi:MAG TPA: hypothetical protein EYN89_09820 [Flavobacteriales bacterium]|nr:hypothetical protein [Flavobacteriales bacterium]
MLKELGKSIILYGIASGISKSIMLFLIPVYTNVFPPEDYAVIDLIATVTIFIAIMGMLQIESGILRYYFEISENQRSSWISTGFWFISIISILLAFITSLFSNYISTIIFDTGNYSKILTIALFTIPISNIFSYCTVIIRCNKEPISYLLFTSLQLIFTIIISLWLVLARGYGVEGAFWGIMFGFLVPVFFMIIYLLKKSLLKLEISGQALNSLFHYCIPQLPGILGSWANTYANRFVMLSYLTLTEIGIFSVAIKIAGVFKLGEEAFRMSWGPFLFENLKKEGHKQLFGNVLVICTLLVMSLCSICALFTKEIYFFIIASSYNAGIPLTSMLFFALGFNILIQIVLIGPAITKKTIFNSVLGLSSFLVNIILLLLMVPKWGLIGVPLSLLLANLFMFISSWYTTERIYYIGFPIMKVATIITIGLLLLGLTLVFNQVIIIRMLLAIAICILFLVGYKSMKSNILNNL